MSEQVIKMSDGARLHVAQAGEGPPVLFLHEFAGDHRSWAPQVDDLSADHRCITYAARGYLPSDVPVSPSSYSWQRAMEDAIDVLDALHVDTAHIVGLSMGGYTAVQLGLHHPDRIRSVLAASVGSGSDPATRAEYLAETRIVANRLRTAGTGVVGRLFAEGPSRVQLKHQNRPAWDEFIEQFTEHSAEGLALTILQVQAERPSFHELLEQLAEFSRPLLVVDGDEDEACLSTGLLLKRTVPTCGLRVLPNSGHLPNLEDAAQFNAIVRRFVQSVDNGVWPVRDPRTKLASSFGFDGPIPIGGRS
ncbi:UNVERIFIED_ORG: pimeloyl-ACP methyl ester carboxylesterase [Gordonia westfalica J30]